MPRPFPIAGFDPVVYSNNTSPSLEAWGVFLSLSSVALLFLYLFNAFGSPLFFHGLEPRVLSLFLPSLVLALIVCLPLLYLGLCLLLTPPLTSPCTVSDAYSLPKPRGVVRPPPSPVLRDRTAVPPLYDVPLADVSRMRYAALRRKEA